MDEIGEHEQMDIIRYVPEHQWIKDVFQDVIGMSATKQSLVGGVTGWCTGMLISKAGKIAAATMGTTILLLQVAHHQDYVKFNWNKIEDSIQKAGRSIMKETKKTCPSFVSTTEALFKNNIVFASMFAGGFLMGFSF
ncbi:FUN14 domain-containing protein 1-like [Octopus bimaculoides]|uniref:FUN14 domain-containing protein 1 n=1 Tax=Octopus bimaculoides TaxID=37653 RepID=A0A0L8GBR1_OCTBM|nr:FUN14 domain-containing protein 1-like [Octopus bimaculoides]